MKEIFSTTQMVRFNDINLGNHLDYAGLLELAGNSRALFFYEHGISELNIERKGVGTMLKSLNVEYFSEVNFNDKLQFKWFLIDTSRITISVVIKVFNLTNGKEVAEINKKFVFYDYINKKITKIPEIITTTMLK